MVILRLLLLLVVLSAELTNLQGQPSTEGFVSIDCGIAYNYSYVDAITKITYESDDKYTDTGESYKVASNYLGVVSYQTQTVRSFPKGDRNCYMFTNLTINGKYLIRTTFLYGNYDGFNSVKPNNPLLFDLYMGVNKWATVNISDASKEYTYEIVTLTMVNFTWICLLNTGSGTPFISTIELRPIDGNMYRYVTANQSNTIALRYNYGPTTTQMIRYPDDPYDRIWLPFSYDPTVLKEISSPNAKITRYQDDVFQVPFAVLRTAITPINSPNLTIITNIELSKDPNFKGYYTSLHFTELQDLKSNETREFFIYGPDNKLWYTSAITPSYLSAYFIYATQPEIYTHYNYLIAETPRSTLPPFINAIEIYAPLSINNSMTNVEDVNAIFSIKSQYGLKGNWSGDPCTPSQYAWSGLRCKYSIYSQPRITYINLSSSHLIGKISPYFSMLSELQSLDLSCNSLTGDFPDFLENIASLQVLNLSGNDFTGSVPANLKKRADSGFIILTIGQGSCAQTSPHSHVKKTSKLVIIILSVSIPILVLMIASVLYFTLCRKSKASTPRPQGPPFTVHPSIGEPKVGTQFHQFTYKQLNSITNNFTKVIGKGGFGTVYFGTTDDNIEVAVKISKAPSELLTRQFLSEVEILSHVHHRNLVSLIGYCKDGDKLGIVYEYMSQGCLGDHLRGKAGIADTLSWEVRLRISLEAAQGIDYLHTGCGIIHRDVKSNNILLDQKFTAKVADFGFSKIIGRITSSFSAIYGTPGYIDPWAIEMEMLTEKSDVYSFGVVLWEIITGEPAIIQDEKNINIVELVKQRLSKGSIEEIADKRLNQDFNPKSVWNVVDLANQCTDNSFSQRPTMAEVAAVLKESLAIEMTGKNQPVELGHDVSQPNKLW